MSLRKTFDFSLDDKFSAMPKREILLSNQLNHFPKCQQTPSGSQLTFDKRFYPLQSHMPNDSLMHCAKQRSIGKLSFHNADKLRRFEELKDSNIDDLNCKIKKMISKLSEVVSPTHSQASSSYYDSKVKFKTEYSDQTEEDNKLKHEFHCTRDTMEESKVLKGLAITTQGVNKNADINRIKNADTIRRKYKDENNKQMETRTRHEKCKSGLSAFSSSTDTVKQALQDADFIRFKQKLKQSTQKDRQQLGIDLKYGSNTKQTLSKNQNTKSKRELDQKMKDYEKKLNTYNSKKLLLLSSEGDIERIVLGDKTNNSTFYKYSPYNNKQSTSFQPKFQLKIKPKQPISHFEETDRSQQPLTADFRQLTDKNQLQVFLNHLCNQIIHDQQFRNAKKWFSRVNSSKKWDHLMSLIQSKNLDLDQNAMHQIFGLKDEQQNPFFTPRDNEFQIENLVQLFVKSQQYWFDNIVKRYNHQRLFQAGFKNSRIDTIGKGYLTVEDFVRFINMETDQQTRNRDLYIIFQRLRGQDQLTFEQLIEVICQ